MFARTEDTIVALSTATGPSPRCIIRLSGDDALRIAATVFAPLLPAPAGFHCRAGSVPFEEWGVELPAELYVFRAPRSYTGDDLIEIHTIGCVPLVSALLDAMIRAGARQAEPGEFTGRAFLAGKLDLTEVEGIAAMIHAGSDAELRAAEQLMHGRLHRETARIHDELADLLALTEASIDFVDEPIDFIKPSEAANRIERIVDALARLLESAVAMERLETRPRVLLFGPPNAGKSTLFNRLTGLDRAICSSTPGTTRDVITAPVRYGLAEILLMDTAGIAASSPSSSGQVVDAAQAAAARADRIVVVIDGTRVDEASVADLVQSCPQQPSICVINKCDRMSDADRETAKRSAGRLTRHVLLISALHGTGCEHLEERLLESVGARISFVADAQFALDARHRTALANAHDACARAMRLTTDQARVAAVADLIAFELREASAALAEVTGAITTEDLLGRVFSRFCIGK